MCVFEITHLPFALFVSLSVCSSRDIRNFANSTRQLRGCRIIEGFLIMTLIDNFDTTPENETHFPDLVEITEFFLLYHVKGLKSLVNIFPNLRVIRGTQLLTDYALAIYENDNLRVSEREGNVRFRSGIRMILLFVLIYRKSVYHR